MGGKFIRELVCSSATHWKIALYTGIQNSHIVPIDNPKAFPVRTGYDAVIPYRIGNEYIGYAKDDGVVTKVGRTSAEVKYKNGKTEKYTFKEWTSKEESNATFVHRLIPLVKEKQKVKKGDIIYYDHSFFEPDMFDRSKVFYRANMNVTVAWNEVQETYEDALMLSSKVSNETKLSQIKIRDMILNETDGITELVNVGDNLKSTTPLFTLTTDTIKDDKLDKATLDLLQSFIKVSPKAKYEGKLIKINVFYNTDYKNLSKSLKKLVDVSEKFLDSDNSKKYSGRVDSSFSINGVPLEEGKVYIKFYIEVNEGLLTGDKCVIASQLKSTVTTIYDYPIVTENGEEVDALFSQKGALARIVNSPTLMGTLGSCLQALSDKACDIYFG